MSSLTIAQITALIAQMRNAADILEGSLVPAANKAQPSEQPARKERSDKGKSRSKKPAADEEPPEDAPKAAKEPKARKPNAWKDFVKLSGGVIKASAAKKADPDSYNEFVENWNAENPVPTKSAAPKKASASAPAPKPKAKAKVVPLLPASDDEGEAQQHELVNIEGVNYWLDTDMNMLFQDEEGEPGDFAHFYKDGEIVNHL